MYCYQQSEFIWIGRHCGKQLTTLPMWPLRILALPFTGNVFCWGQPAGHNQAHVEPRPLCCVLGKQRRPRQVPQDGLQSQGCQGCLRPLHVTCMPHNSGTDSREMGRNYILERAVESTWNGSGPKIKALGEKNFNSPQNTFKRLSYYNYP